MRKTKLPRINLTPDQNCNSPYCQPYNSFKVSLENLVLDQLIIPKLIFFFILITYLVDIVWILWEEVLSLSLMGVKGLIITLENVLTENLYEIRKLFGPRTSFQIAMMKSKILFLFCPIYLWKSSLCKILGNQWSYCWSNDSVNTWHNILCIIGT